MLVSLESAIGVASLVIGIITFYQKWNDKIMRLTANDARQDIRLEHLEKRVETLEHNL